MEWRVAKLFDNVPDKMNKFVQRCACRFCSLNVELRQQYTVQCDSTALFAVHTVHLSESILHWRT